MVPPQGPPVASRRWPVRAERLELDFFDLAGDRTAPAIDHLDLFRPCLAAESETQMRTGTADAQVGHIGRQLLQWSSPSCRILHSPTTTNSGDDLPRSPVGRILSANSARRA